MDERRRRFDDLEGKSGSELLIEVMRLLGLLLLTMLKLVGRLVVRLLRLLLKYFCRLLLLIIDACIRARRALVDFWNDNDTQQKVLKLRNWTSRALRRTGQALVFAALQSWLGIVWLAKKTLEGIIHLGPTLCTIGHALWKVLCAVGRAFVRLWQSICLWAAGRRDAYRRFRRNKGFKGLLLDIATWMKQQLHNYIEEESPQLPADDTEADYTSESGSLTDYVPDAADDDADNPFLNDDVQHTSRMRGVARRIYESMKRIVEEE